MITYLLHEIINNIPLKITTKPNVIRREDFEIGNYYPKLSYHIHGDDIVMHGVVIGSRKMLEAITEYDTEIEKPLSNLIFDVESFIVSKDGHIVDEFEHIWFDIYDTVEYYYD